MLLTRSLAFWACVSVAAQAQTPEPVIRSQVREVVLDLAVRNKSEKLVRDLRADEVEVFVDGVKQEFRGFRLVTGEEIRKLAASTPAALALGNREEKLPPAYSAREINLVALVFRTGSTIERTMAQKAALAFINGELPPHTYIAVLTLSKVQANVIQSFTSNRELLTAAINYSLSNSGSHEAGAQLAALQAPGTAATSAGHQGAVGQSGGFDSKNPATAMLDASVASGAGAVKVAQLEADAVFTDFNTEARFEMDQLQAIIGRMAGLPGRKTVISMVSTLAIPDEEPEYFERVVANARREGITFYGVNLRGLSKSSTFSDARTSLYSAAETSPTQDMGGTPGSGQPKPGVTRAQARQDDQILYGVRSADRENALRVLAEDTGGFLIANTNDVASQMPRIMDEVNTHYELAWTPVVAKYDGSFHKIEVRVGRHNVHTQYRTGYYALPDLNGHVYQSYELAGMREFDMKPARKDFEFRASALRFSPANGEWHGVMAFEAPIGSFASISGAERGRMEVHATAVAVVKNPLGEIVGMVSDKVNYTVPSDKRDGFMAGNLTLTLPVELQPGHWTIEAAMMAPQAQTAAVKRISVFVPKPGTPAISTITLSRRVELAPASEAALTGPFDMGAARVIPTLTDQIPAESASSLYFVVYPSSEIQERPNVVIQYFRDGKQVAQESPAVRSDWSGSIPMMASAKLAPGEYEVRVTASQGNRAARESAWIRVNE